MRESDWSSDVCSSDLVSKAVRKTMEELEGTMPDGIEYVIALDTTDFVRISINEVIHTLFEAIVLVVLVVYFFLQSLRSTVICIAAIMVSLIGTFAGMLALGFSINLLTLFGIVLAIGMVVDDAIVVTENVERNMTKFHLGAREATIRAMGEISTALIAVVLVMASVFVPAAFLPGTTGQLYKQFAITIVISVAISGFVALTLSPAMCGLLLKHTTPSRRGVLGWINRFFAWFNRGFQRFTLGFGDAVVFMIRRMVIAFIILALLIWALVHLFRATPTSFVPNEDQGYVMAQLLMPDAASLNRTVATSGLIDRLFAESAAVENRTTINGYSLLDGQYKSNVATFFVTFKDFDKRYASKETARSESAEAVLRDVARKAGTIETGRFVPIMPPAIMGIGTTGGFEFWIQDKGTGDPAHLYEVTQQFLAKARERPELTGLNTTFRAASQQLRAEVDRSKAVLLRVPISDVYSALQAQFGSIQVSQFNQYSRVWNVILQSEARYRGTPSDITRLYTRSMDGRMVPLSALVSTRYVTGPDLVPHFNGFPAAYITGDASPGYSSGAAISAMEEVAKEVLPQGYGFAWSGMAYEEKKSGGTSASAFVFGLVIVFLVLAAQFESWILPGSVLTAVPSASSAPWSSTGCGAQQRCLLPDRPFGAHWPRSEERGAPGRLRGRFAQAGAFDHGRDHTGRRGAPAAHHHDFPRLHLRRAAPRHRHRRGRQRPPLHRHGHYGRHDRRDDPRHALCAPLLLPLRDAGRAPAKEGRPVSRAAARRSPEGRARAARFAHGRRIRCAGSRFAFSSPRSPPAAWSAPTINGPRSMFPGPSVTKRRTRGRRPTRHGGRSSATPCSTP
jgi:multidrug efflux pump